jgi:hypothetical protein
MFLVSSAGAVPRVFQLRTSQCRGGDESRSGTGFIVRSFPNGPRTANVLVTALHVVHGCEDIEIYDLSCQTAHADAPKWSVPRGTTIDVWTNWDIAVVPLEGDPLALGVEVVDEQLALSAEDLQRLAEEDRRSAVPSYTFTATSQSNKCIHTLVTHVALRPAPDQFEELAAFETRRKKKRVSSEDLQGSLSKDAYLLDYNGEMDRGASGAPVTLDGVHVLAMHDAGFVNRENSGWGIVLGESGLETTTPVPVVMNSGSHGLTEWPTVQATYLEQNATDELADQSDRARARAELQPSRNVLSLRVNSPLRAQELALGHVGGALTFEYARHGRVGEIWGGLFKIGATLNLTYGYLQTERRFESPSGAGLEASTKGMQEVVFAPGIDFRLDRFDSWFSPSLSIGVLVGRWIFPDDAQVPSDPTRWNAGFWGALSNRWAFHCKSADEACVHFLYGVEASTQYTPSFEYRYTGVGGEVHRASDDGLAGYVGLRIGLEWFGVGR